VVPGSLLSVFALLGSAFAQQQVVGIFYEFEEEPTPAAYEAMIKETRALLHPAGIQVVWRKRGTAAGSETFSKVLFLKFKGACKAPLAPVVDTDEFRETVRLGASRVAGEQILPVAEVNCGEIQRFIGRAPAKQRGIALGWAMARVTAHELYHVLLQTLEHGKRGLSKAVVSASELGSPSFSFDHKDLKQFSAAIEP
jgi:hypothetical protein